jgi:hypothetical protein
MKHKTLGKALDKSSSAIEWTFKKLILPTFLLFLVCAYTLGFMRQGLGLAQAASPLTFGSKLCTMKVAMPSITPAYDVHKVCKAIAWSESTGCRNAVNNNCHGLMYWDSSGVRHLRKFKSTAESFRECERVWTKFYGALPTKENGLSIKYNGADHDDQWLKNFYVAYTR